MKGRQTRHIIRRREVTTASTLYDLPIIDAHTHTSGPDADGTPAEAVRCMDQCGVEMAFMFAPLLDVHGHLAHLGWPWVDECIATLAMETFHPQSDRKDHWQLKVDLSFGCPPDWQVDSFRKALNMLPHDMLMYASDVFWPCDRQRYMEEFAYPQLATFEAAATLARDAGDPGSHQRVLLRRAVFHDNALNHWQHATRGREQQF